MSNLESGLKIVKDHTMYRVINAGGQGPVPAYLRGVFTNETIAKQRIDMFNAMRKEKLEKKPRIKKIVKEV